MILDIYKDAFEYSAQDWKALIKLGIISVLSFLILPIFLTYGYSYRVTKMAVEGMIGGGEPLPDFNDIIGMFVDGVKVVIVYLVPAIVVLLVMFVLLAIAGSAGDASGILAFITIIITFVLAVFAVLFAMMGVAHMASNDGAFKKAFAFGELREIISSIGALRLIAAYIGLMIISAVIYTVISIVITLIFGILGIGGSVVGLGADVSGGIVGFGVLLTYAVIIFIAGPYLTILQARTNGLLYNLH